MGKGMGDMSPLARFVLIAMLWGVRFVAMVVAAIFALVVWQRALSSAAAGFVGQDYSVLTVLALLFIAALWFARAVMRELSQ